MITTRLELTNLLQENSIGRELGVFFCGDFSQELLNSGKFSTLYLVDPFEGQIESGDKDGNNIQRFNGREIPFIEYEYTHSDGTFFVGEKHKRLTEKLYSLGYSLSRNGEYNILAQKI